MTPTQQRNEEIVQMRAQGVPRRELADRFGITPGRIAMIEQRAAVEEAKA